MKEWSRQGARGAVQQPLSTSTLIVWGQECIWAVKRYINVDDLVSPASIHVCVSQLIC